MCNVHVISAAGNPNQITTLTVTLAVIITLALTLTLSGQLTLLCVAWPVGGPGPMATAAPDTMGGPDPMATAAPAPLLALTQTMMYHTLP